MRVQILLVEDDPETGGAIERHLVRAGHDVRLIADGHAAAVAGAARRFDVAILDRALPSRDGLTVLQSWRAAGLTVPVLLLTGMTKVEERIEGLSAGADDYLSKPFDLGELEARLVAITRRRAIETATPRLRVGSLELDLLQRSAAAVDLDRSVRLQPRECGMLALLIRNSGTIVTRKMLIEAVWGYAFDPGTNIVESHMCRLRTKLAELGMEPIETLRGLGYRFAVS